MIESPIDHLFTLQRSPFAVAPIIHQFYKHSTPHKRDVLLSYLVLPMVLYPPMRDYLLTVRSTSSLRTLCKNQARLVGLTVRVQEFKPLTHAAMLVLKAEQGIEVTDDLAVKAIGEVRTANTNQEQLEAGRRLALICKGVDVVSIYRTLGFKSL